eukprot:6960496-Pyramimonas_sp.AAC.1
MERREVRAPMRGADGAAGPKSLLVAAELSTVAALPGPRACGAHFERVRRGAPLPRTTASACSCSRSSMST